MLQDLEARIHIALCQFTVDIPPFCSDIDKCTTFYLLGTALKRLPNVENSFDDQMTTYSFRYTKVDFMQH
ncbi:unnamed protein product [Absidia cylindrospora]